MNSEPSPRECCPPAKGEFGNSFRGEQAISYTHEVIDEDHRRWLCILPRHIRLQLGKDAEFSVLMVHGSPRKINEYLFENRPESSMERLMVAAGADVMLLGHTHKPYHRVLVEEGDEGQKRYRHAIKIGSVGKPKDGDPWACWALLTVDEDPEPGAEHCFELNFVRVSYDVEEAARGGGRVAASRRVCRYAAQRRESRKVSVRRPQSAVLNRPGSSKSWPVAPGAVWRSPDSTSPMKRRSPTPPPLRPNDSIGYTCC